VSRGALSPTAYGPTTAARVIHSGKEAAYGLTGPEDVRLARRLRRTRRREHRLGRCGTLRRRPQMDRRDREQRRRAPHRCRHLCGMGRLLAQRLRIVRRADERDPEDRVLELAHIGRLVRDDDRRRRPHRNRHAARAGALRRLPARARRGTFRPITGRDRPDRRVPPCRPPRSSWVRASGSSTRRTPSSRRAPPSSPAEPSPTFSQPTPERARSATRERTPLAPRLSRTGIAGVILHPVSEQPAIGWPSPWW
jgi:hypothetical protein